jgi:branched-chain amino acid transport system substrate-binding protein
VRAMKGPARPRDGQKESAVGGRFSRRTVLRTGLTVAGGVIAGALGQVRPLAYAQAPGRTIRIGFLTDLTGPVAPSGRHLLNGFQLYLEEHQSRLAGRPVDFLVEDVASQPSNALTRTRKLVEQDGAHVIIGLALASEGYAIRDYVVSRDVPTLFPVVSADDLTQRKRAPNIVRTGWSSSQPSHPFGDWVAETLRYRKIAIIGTDYAFGYEVAGGFQRTFELHGGQIVQKIWVPLGTPDYAPYVTKLRRDVDAVFGIIPGADGIRFVKAYRQYGLKDRIPLIGGGNITDESLLPSLSPEDAVGIVTALMWSAALLTPQARKFVAAYNARYKTDPPYFAESAYTTARWLDLALQRIGGRAEDGHALVRALKGIQLPDAPRGPVRLDAYNNPVQNIYIRRVEYVNGRLQNTVIYTFHNVSQFWTFPPAEFLKQPVYSRDYPPCRYCG